MTDGHPYLACWVFCAGNNEDIRPPANVTVEDNSNDITSGVQSVRAPRRPRKRSSLCNNVDLDDVFLDDVQSHGHGQSHVHSHGQSDELTTGRRTSVPHQRHTEASANREHRPKRKGEVFRLNLQ